MGWVTYPPEVPHGSEPDIDNRSPSSLQRDSPHNSHYGPFGLRDWRIAGSIPGQWRMAIVSTAAYDHLVERANPLTAPLA
jgi:hypothetical protein